MVDSQPLSSLRTFAMVNDFLLFGILSSLGFQNTTSSWFSPNLPCYSFSVFFAGSPHIPILDIRVHRARLFIFPSINTLLVISSSLMVLKTIYIHMTFKLLYRHPSSSLVSRLIYESMYLKSPLRCPRGISELKFPNIALSVFPTNCLSFNLFYLHYW